MCSLTGALALATCVTVEWWPGRHYAAPSHTDRWSQAPTLASPVSLSPLVLYPLCPDPCCSLHITHPPGECDLASLAAVSGWLGSSLLTCQYPLQQKVFSNGLHTAHGTPQPQTLDTLGQAGTGDIPLHPVSRAAVLQPAEGERVISRGSRLQSLERRLWLIRLHLRQWELRAAAAWKCLFCEIFLVVSSAPQPEICHSEGGSRGTGDIMEEFYWNWTIPNMSPLSCQEEDWVFNHFGIHLILSWALLINLFVIIWHDFFLFLGELNDICCWKIFSALWMFLSSSPGWVN